MVFFSSCNSVKFHYELFNYIDISVQCIHVSTAPFFGWIWFRKLLVVQHKILFLNKLFLLADHQDQFLGQTKATKTDLHLPFLLWGTIGYSLLHRCSSKRFRYPTSWLDCTVWSSWWTSGVYTSVFTFLLIKPCFLKCAVMMMNGLQCGSNGSWWKCCWSCVTTITSWRAWVFTLFKTSQSSGEWIWVLLE